MNVTRKSIAYNGFFSLVDKAYTTLTNLAIIPFIVHRLGMDVYGIWVVLTTVSSYFWLGSFGIAFTYEKFIAQYHATGDVRSMQRFIATVTYASAALSVGVLFMSEICGRFVFHLLLKNDSLERYMLLFLLLMLSGAFSMVTTVVAAVPRGLQRYDFSSAISVIARTFYIAAVIVLCIKGFGLFSLVAAQYILFFVTGVLSLIVARRFLGSVSLDPRLFDWSMLRTILSFGTKMQTSLLSVMIMQTFDKLLIAHFLGVRLVAMYDIGSKLIVYLKDAPSFLFASITSRTSQLHSLDNHAELQELYCRGTKYLSVICLGAIPLLFPVAGEILAVWMRRAVDPLSLSVFQVLLFSTMFNATTGLGTSIGVGIGKPGIIAYSNMVMAFVNIVASFAFFFAFGPTGIVWGTTSGLVVSTLLYYELLNRKLNVGRKLFMSTVLSIPLFVNAIALLALVAVRGFYEKLAQFVGIGPAADYGIIVVNGILTLAISVALYAMTKFITLNELLEYAPFLKKSSGPRNI